MRTMKNDPLCKLNVEQYPQKLITRKHKKYKKYRIKKTNKNHLTKSEFKKIQTVIQKCSIFFKEPSVQQ